MSWPYALVPVSSKKSWRGNTLYLSFQSARKSPVNGLLSFAQARKKLEKIFPRDDPKSASGVVWTGYETLAQPGDHQRDRGRQDLSLVFRNIKRRPLASLFPLTFATDDDPAAGGSRRPVNLTDLSLLTGQSIEKITAKARQLQKVRDLAVTMHQGHPTANEDEDDEEAADAALATADTQDYVVWTSYFVGLFHRVISYEAHQLKNCRTRRAVAVDKILAAKKWLLWDPAWKADLELLDNFSPSDPLSGYRLASKEDWPVTLQNYARKYGKWTLWILDPAVFATLMNPRQMQLRVNMEVERRTPKEPASKDFSLRARHLKLLPRSTQQAKSAHYQGTVSALLLKPHLNPYQITPKFNHLPIRHAHRTTRRILTFLESQGAIYYLLDQLQSSPNH
ncbi:hypothetical protein PV08_07351 [Exophiala spinifera]|uniref:Uncharacterized protein n=1 Tax=Exophiala spinifera TaxID=91928 RepID=A0A0D1ZP48_9EURO|nr:uncharacterized protein PV08_07351 [Exophiala spinifera]KIW14567.1 hypothetical protein PV08_07351 [Exophiala spinifera]